MSLVVDDIYLGAKHHLNAKHLARERPQIGKIKVVAGSGDSLGVFGDAKQLKPDFGSGLCHFGNSAVGVSAGDGVGVNVKQCFHVICPFSPAVHPADAACFQQRYREYRQG